MAVTSMAEMGSAELCGEDKAEALSKGKEMETEVAVAVGAV